MSQDLIARVTALVHASHEDVWQALVSPKAIKQYMFGADVTSDWREGRPITWQGEWQGKPYQDKGVILQVQPRKLLQYSHFSPLSGLRDEPANYHTVTIELTPEPEGTQVALTQDHNATAEERAHSEKNWSAMLTALEQYLEEHRHAPPRQVSPQ